MSKTDIRNLDLGLLRTFDALMRERSVSRTASRLFLSQSAVSSSLQRLRAVFGDELFVRTARGVQPSARALSLAGQIEKILGDVATLLETPGVFDPARSDRIFRVAGSDHTSERVLAPLSRTLTACGSGVRVFWEAAGATPLGERLRKGEFDLAVIARLHRPMDMQSEVLYEDDYVYITRPDHPQVGTPVTLDAFCTTPQVLLGYGSSVLGEVIDEILARQKRRRPAQFSVSSFGQIIDLLQHNDHAAVIARKVALLNRARLALHELPFALPRYQMRVCWTARGGDDPGREWLKQQVKAVLSV
ncbi:MAG: LysR family transcriptional regulator [Burkholderiaceae bacterium]|nr:LysR family transcriptional regulator [Burkholderiaceae bacterium]